MKALVLFYSYGGNTRRVAKLVQQETGCDLCEDRDPSLRIPAAITQS